MVIYFFLSLLSTYRYLRFCLDDDSCATRKDGFIAATVDDRGWTMYFHLVSIGITTSFLDGQDWFVGFVLLVGTDDMLVDMYVFDCHE